MIVVASSTWRPQTVLLTCTSHDNLQSEAKTNPLPHTPTPLADLDGTAVEVVTEGEHNHRRVGTGTAYVTTTIIIDVIIILVQKGKEASFLLAIFPGKHA